MNESLCREFGGGAFPTAGNLAGQEVKALQQKAGLGYRAKSVKALAQQVIQPRQFLETGSAQTEME